MAGSSIQDQTRLSQSLHLCSRSLLLIRLVPLHVQFWTFKEASET